MKTRLFSPFLSRVIPKILVVIPFRKSITSYVADKNGNSSKRFCIVIVKKR